LTIANEVLWVILDSVEFASDYLPAKAAVDSSAWDSPPAHFLVQRQKR
jgi:hypothetical protein